MNVKSYFFDGTRHFLPAILEIMLAAVVVRLLGMVEPFAMQAIIDRVLPFQRDATLNLVLILLVLNTLFSSALQSLMSYTGGFVGNGINGRVATGVFKHVVDIPLMQIQRYQVGDILSRVGEISNITQFYAGKVPNILIEIAFFFIYFIILFGISSQLGLIILLYLPIQMALFFGFGPGIRARARISFENGSRHQSRLVETLTNLSVIKTLAMGERQVKRLNSTLNASVVSHFSVFKFGLWNTTIIDIFAGLNTVFVIYFGSRLVLANTISLGELIAFHLIAEKIAGPVHSLSLVWEDWQNLKVSQTRIGDLTDIAAENIEIKPTLIVKRPCLLACNDVYFDYPGEVSVLSNLNLVFETEKPNVIIGPSGCGKSTLGKVLCGLFAPKAGRVLVNGEDIAHYDLVSVRRQIAYVEQEPKLFSGTIRENMLFGRPDADDDAINGALRVCAAIDFVEKLPLGLDTNIAEWGASLSGGQRQRLVLARAVLSNSAVLILDEPTSALDKAAARIIQNTLIELSKELVLIVISHDETILGADAKIIDLGKMQNSNDAER